MSTQTPEIKVYANVEEFQAAATAQFGSDPWKWKFRCPVCGHVQTPEMFLPYKDKGAVDDSCAVECLGRYLEKRKSAIYDSPNKPGPCDYAAFGLLPMGVHLVGKRKVFPFADPDDPLGLKEHGLGVAE